MATSASRHTSRGQFQETHWSVILNGAKSEEGGMNALNHLVTRYRKPLYSFIRFRGFGPQDAEDLVQSFFLEIIKRNALISVDPKKGRFRSFLLASLKNFLANEWDRQSAQKRGGKVAFASLDDPRAEALYEEVKAAALSPEQLFDRIWALELVDRVFIELREEYKAEGRLSTFEALESVLSSTGRTVSYGDVAQRLCKTEENVRMSASRLRRRFREILRDHVSQTVSEPAEVEEELRYLFSCL